MRIYFNHPVLIDGHVVTFCNFETWEPNEADLAIASYEIGIKVTWKREGISERRVIPWSNIAICEVKNYDVSP